MNKVFLKVKQGHFLEGRVVSDWALVDDQVYIGASGIKVVIDLSKVTSERCFP